MSSSNRAEQHARAYHTERTQENRDQVVFAAEPVIRSIISRMTLPGDDLARPEDLFHMGVCAVLQSLDQYDPSNGVQFITFAYPRIRGEIVDYLRRLDPLPRRRRIKVAAARHASDRMAQVAGCIPSATAVANELGIEERELRVIELDATRRNMSYLFDSHREGEGLRLVECLEDKTATDRMDEMETSDIRRYLDACVSDFPERDRVILDLYFREDMTLSEIGQLLGLSEARVSQLRRAALNKLVGMVEENLRTAA